MEHRNPTFTEDGRIDMEVNHPVYGWIPFTADPNDPEKHGRDLFAEASLGEVAPYVPPPQFVPDIVTARQFKLQLLASGLLDTVNAWVETQGQAAQISYEYATHFNRNDPIMQQGFADLGFTSDEVDAFYIAASSL